MLLKVNMNKYSKISKLFTLPLVHVNIKVCVFWIPKIRLNKEAAIVRTNIMALYAKRYHFLEQLMKIFFKIAFQFFKGDRLS